MGLLSVKGATLGGTPDPGYVAPAPPNRLRVIAERVRLLQSPLPRFSVSVGDFVTERPLRGNDGGLHFLLPASCFLLPARGRKNS